MINHIAGLPVHILDDTHIFVEPGSAALWSGTGWDVDQIDFTAIYNIDMNTVGLNGRDAGSFSNGCYMVYALYNPTTGERGFIASKAIRFQDAVIPSGFTSWRKLMYGVTVIGGRCVPVHSTCWPMPVVEFTEQLQVAALTTQSPNWVTLDLSAYVPENARFCMFRVVMTGASCNAWMASSSSGYGSRLVSYNQQGVIAGFGIRIDSAQKVFAWLGSSGARMDIYLEGFKMTETT